MKNILTIIVLCCTVLLACVNQGNRKLHIKGTIQNATVEEIILKTPSKLGEEKEVIITSLDSIGNFSLEWDIDIPKEAILVLGKIKIDLFVEPGDHLELIADADDLNQTLSFSGRGSVVNQYLQAKNEKLEELNKKTGNLWKYSEEEFLYKLEERKEIIRDLYAEFFKGKKIPAAFSKYEEITNQMSMAINKERYPQLRGYFSKSVNVNMGEDYFGFREQIDMQNEKALRVSTFREYLRSVYAQNSLSDIVENNKAYQGDYAAAYRANIDTISRDENLGDATRKYLVAQIIYDHISYFGVDGIREMYNVFREENPQSEYLEALEENYNKWAVMARGEKAPDFEYMNVDGGRLALSDFLGKVVYIDVWATWCSPCKAEFPYAAQLKTKYKEAEDLIFMYVSVDENKEAWKTMLDENPDFKGVHLIAENGWQSEIMHDYLISGIPRYILIDREGIIFSSSAPRPSSAEKLEKMLEELLDKKAISAVM